VGLQFILRDELEKRRSQAPAIDAAGRREFERFLERLKLDNDAAA
jgi:hypothetical protein